jgi:holo-[acyl-carrier protein] synthase
MTIVGLGLDAAEIPRVAAMLERYGDRFRNRVYTHEEIAYCEQRRTAASSYAARFAAKEAGMKAIGTGHSRGVVWHDLEVVRMGGPPQLRFHNAALRHMRALGATRALLTLTHTDNLAIAHVILVAD